MDNIIKFPTSSEDSDEPPLAVEFSATPEELLHYCVGKILALQASVETMRIAIATDLTLLSHNDVLDLDEANKNYRQVRRSTLEGLCRELQERFPPGGKESK